jgi:hypothetical protein
MHYQEMLNPSTQAYSFYKHDDPFYNVFLDYQYSHKLYTQASLSWGYFAFCLISYKYHSNNAFAYNAYSKCLDRKISFHHKNCKADGLSFDAYDNLSIYIILTRIRELVCPRHIAHNGEHDVLSLNVLQGLIELETF